MSKSIISNERECVVCGDTRTLHRHHVYAGSNRKWSEKYGCWCYLCPNHHNMSDYGVHKYKPLDTALKMSCQAILEADGWSRDEFIKIFGRSYI